MKTFIIHIPSQTDRENNIVKLASNYDEATIIRGIIPDWIEDAFDRAVLGCSLTHLSILEKYIDTDHILILEDDADIIPEHIKQVEESSIPDDAGILLIGGDNVPNYAANSVENTIYHEVYAPFFGTHAVWYDMSKLRNTNFLLNAYKALASLPVGKNGICYESVIAQGINNTGLKIFRPADMLYTTISSYSSRDQVMSIPNVDTISIIKDK